MLHAIGTKPRAHADLVDTLLECHARIRHFTALAVALGERDDIPAGEVADGCARVERYFVEAMPLHVRDEEDSVLPRLVGRSAAVDAALAWMRREHELHAFVIERTCAAARALQGHPLDARARSKLLAIARPLEFVLGAHLRAEEETIFPLIRERLAPAEQESIHRELRRRRLLDGFR